MVEDFFCLAGKKRRNSNTIVRLLDYVQTKNVPTSCAYGINQHFPKTEKEKSIL
ncbi:hypothetical protein CLNEO_06710 [Anaerotignum neopropionicum]|uniref:Uncharacterized protein n=1 Tax=Anaerotignum neopropionicum TaxID=36847 RepID=A0A136WJJ3_9FIRM|nr:hypothetical protein CLNEO_06710 [Anaerotignum neopropionicum]